MDEHLTSSSEPRDANQVGRRAVQFSICTLVTDRTQYAEMVATFRAHGFDGPDCEYLYLDNSLGNEFDAFVGTNIFLRNAVGAYIILCHQDVILVDDDREKLLSRMAELSQLDPDWAVCGNAGSTAAGPNAIRISDPHGSNQKSGPFPVRAVALDENFIVVRGEANLAVSHDLSGFHLYGADLCIIADILGRSAWVIDFHLHHKSAGRADQSFYQGRQAMIKKYRRALRTRRINTTVTSFYLRAGIVRSLIEKFR